MLRPCVAHDLAEQLEFLAKEGEVDQASAVFRELKEELDRALPEIAAFVNGELNPKNS
jgi:hypothetical protein